MRPVSWSRLSVWEQDLDASPIGDEGPRLLREASEKLVEFVRSVTVDNTHPYANSRSRGELVSGRHRLRAV
jgi:hypothetical protein